MKKFIAIVSIVVFCLAFTLNAIAQGGPPPPPSDENDISGGSTPIGGNAPIGGGLFILLGLGAAYGSRKLYKFHQEDEAFS